MEEKNIIAGLVADIDVKEAYQSIDKDSTGGADDQFWTVVYMDGTANTFKYAVGGLRPLWVPGNCTANSDEIQNFLSPFYYDVKRVK